MKISSVLALVVVATLVSAAQCWEQHNMPNGTWTYFAWLCNASWVPSAEIGSMEKLDNYTHGSIITTAPRGVPSEGRTFKVWVSSFKYSSPYPVVLRCYEGTGVPRYDWQFKQQVTLYASQYTWGDSAWVKAGCPTVMNAGQNSTNPPQVYIDINWAGSISGAGGKAFFEQGGPEISKRTPPILSHIFPLLRVRAKRKW